MSPYSHDSAKCSSRSNHSARSSSSTSSCELSGRKSLDQLCNDQDLLQIAAHELEILRNAAEKALDSNICCGASRSGSAGVVRRSCDDGSRSFPPACLSLLQSLPGNRRCIDCGEADASWASVSFGAVMCLRCSGKHRGLGVKTSYIKSLTMDSWNHTQVLSMLEGGNQQLSQFFARHKMGNDDHEIISVSDRYKTKAASFYRHHLSSHAKDVAGAGVYKGRDASREASRTKHRQSQRQQRSHQRKGVCKREHSVAVAPQLCTVQE